MTAANVAVLDVGKSNVKLVACTPDGAAAETLSTPNPVLPGPPWRHHDLAALSEWVFGNLAALAARHRLTDFIATGHGSGGVLVGDDPGAGDGTALPMVDYEQPLPAGLDAAYAPQSGGFFDRGSARMMAATHTARQMFWAERERPEAFARARWLLGVPQYWAWRLTGVPVSEVSILGAQSHLWNVPERRWAPIVAARGWGRLMPPFAEAGAVLGRVRPGLGLPPLRVHAGLHDSTSAFTRFQRGGLADAVMVSTGTWIVALASGVDLSRLEEARGATCNADVAGNPVAGALTMGGREYAAVAGGQLADARADAAVLARLVRRGTMALPAFGGNDGQFPGSAGRGRIAGPPPDGSQERHALAVLYTALLTVAAIDALDTARDVVLDGTFLRDPAFAALVAALRPGRRTFTTPETNGIAAGAALLCSGAVPDLPLQQPEPLPGLPDLAPYSARWRALAEGRER
jgi:sugar (pentulose or hexulose) kinase